MADPVEPNRALLENYAAGLRAQAGYLLDHRLRNLFNTSDIVQQTILQAHQHWGQFRGKTENELRAWLRQILRNQVRTYMRRYLPEGDQREKSLQSFEESSAVLEKYLAAEDSSPSDQAVRQERVDLLLTEIVQLPQDQRVAVELHHLKGCSLNDTAQQMGRSIQSVAGLLQRGLKQLREFLPPES
jgi:RNA polymerase sigma-70 factor (ECF subfamily)